MPGLDTLVAGGAELAGGLIKGLVGGHQKREGKRLLNSLQYPTEGLPSEITQNQVAAQQQAATGLPSEQYANAMKNIQRQQLFALKSAHDRRGGLGAIAGIQQGTNDATLNLDAKDAQMRLANQQNLQNVNNQVAGWKSRLFNYNVRDKYNRDYQYGQNLVGYGNQNQFAGLDQGIAGIGQIGIGLFGKGKSNNNNDFSGYNPAREGFNSSGYATGVF